VPKRRVAERQNDPFRVGIESVWRASERYKTGGREKAVVAATASLSGRFTLTGTCGESILWPQMIAVADGPLRHSLSDWEVKDKAQ
jgi:hypothetical protein